MTATPPSLVHGWGRAGGSAAGIVAPATGGELAALVDGAAAPTLVRGLGRSYGDAAQCGGGTLIDSTGLDAVLAAEDASGTIRVEAGISIDALLRAIVPRGWFVPVTPGTAMVTVGGAVAADVHGKNHHRDGSIASHLEAIVLHSPDGVHDLSPSSDPDLFWATAGGMGLTGAISEATIRLVPVETSRMVVDTERAPDLFSCMASLADGDERYRYSVAWIDGMARGGRLGRSVITRADHARASDLARRSAGAPLAYAPRERFSLGVTPPVNVLNAATVAAFNELWFRRAPKRRVGEVQSIREFFYPLDAFGGWNRLYGPRGFTQYQFVVPFGAEEVVRVALERLQACRAPSFLAVLKRFGPGDAGPLSFPAPGWTLALDLALGVPGLSEVLDGLDEAVVAAGGRVYLAKDGRVRAELLDAMYPRLEAWREVRDRVDPNGVFVSDLARRLGLVGRRAPVGARS